MADVFVDLYFEHVPGSGYHVYGVGRGGTKKYVAKHFPWFALYVPKGTVRKALETVRGTKYVVGAEEVDIRARTPLLPLHRFRHEPSPSYAMIRVYVEKKEYVPQLAQSLEKTLKDALAGVYNIVYAIRTSFDLDIKYFHPKCPLIVQPNKDLEALVVDVIERNKDLKVMSFDIEVATSPGRFPKPGDPVISIQYAVTRLSDPDFSDPSWPKDNVDVLTAESKGYHESKELVRDFFKVLKKERPDILVGYNSTSFDVKYIRPFIDDAPRVLPDPRHLYFADVVIPHVDLMIARDRMGSSLGLRSLRARALEDVVRELAKGTPFDWVLGSRYMLAEERLDHTKLVSEWERRSQLFYDYVVADAYFTLILAYLWMYTLILLSSILQVPVTELTKLNTGQIAEYNIVHWLEMLGFEPPIIKRTKEFRKVLRLGPFSAHLDGGHADLFAKGKVHVKTYGVFRYVLEADFAQLYPTLMSNECVDPTAFRARKVVTKNFVTTAEYADPIFRSESKIRKKEFPVLLGTKPSASADHMVPEELYLVLPTYGPVSFLFYKMFLMRKITKKLKKRAKKEGRPELKAPDQAVKILNNASYGAFSKRRGFINPVMSAYVFWKTLKILYDVIGYAEGGLGLSVLYGDTDSVFIQCKVDEARKRYPGMEAGEACEEWFRNEVLPKLNEYVQRKYGKEFEIEFEDRFDVCIFPKLKRGPGASKKSYICGKYEDGKLKVVVFKGDFFKVLAPEGIREKLADFYECVIEKRPKSGAGVEKLMRDFLAGQPPHKYFVKKIVNSFRSEKLSEKEEKKYAVKLKNLNKNFHYAALHTAYAWNLPGVSVVREFSQGNYRYVEYHVDAERVFDTGDIVVYFLPGSSPKEFTLYVDYDEEKDMVRVHRVYVLGLEITRVEEDGVVRETGYKVRAKYVDEWVPRKKILADAVRSARKYLIDDIEKKLLPALTRTFGGNLDTYAI